MTDEIVTPAVAPVAPVTPATPVVEAAAPPQDFPNDWREKLSGEDADMRKMMDRYNSPSDLAKKAFEQDKLIRSGAHKKFEAPGADATPEAVSEYRKALGVPESADKYSMPDGVVLGDADKPVVEAFLKDMHGKNMPDSLAKETIDWYFKAQEAKAAADAEADKKFQQENTQALKSEWGGEFQPNYNMAESFAVGNFGEEVGRALMGAGADTVKALARVAREVNPVASLVPNSPNPTGAILDEYNGLMKEYAAQGSKFPKHKYDRLELLAAAKNRMTGT
jgi:hypothetical protein